VSILVQLSWLVLMFIYACYYLLGFINNCCLSFCTYLDLQIRETLADVHLMGDVVCYKTICITYIVYSFKD